ncbi:uncharacterized protein EAF01_001661 [Botrytis porri]|uniref:Uncharacterized protein n=1 Tax=Botrytis porri TaxID=87229 RepID=A0A4Z1L3A8_9HELO|nr:uncharacterized protein EAF01_001661 [Botrytis porri]KAF7912640.1 hypothetical protein EAF01_001661 [Botrytis porri]TGO91304.1 hypothetical protein BPOR_0032g00240 [Botrytis porri]
MAQSQLTNPSTALNTTSSPEVHYELEDRVIKINFRPQGPWRQGGEDDIISKIQQHAATAVELIFDIDFSQPGTSAQGDNKIIKNRIMKIRDGINGGDDPATKVPNDIADVQVTVHMRRWSTAAMTCFGSS